MGVMRPAGRTQRYWRVMADMGFLEDEPLKFLVRHLTPRLQYQDDERDVAALRIEAWGLKQGSRKKITYEVVDYGIWRPVSLP